MADGRGGYRKPEHPAPTSGPGRLSRRTDGGPGDRQAQSIAAGGGYGDRKDMEEIQSGAAMQGGGSPGGDAGPPAPGPAPPPPLGADTERPDEPITAGTDVGEGIGPEAAGIQTDTEMDAAAMRPLLHSLEYIANLPGSNPATRAFVRAMKAKS